MVTKTTRKTPLEELECFNQQAVVWYTKDRYEVTVKQDGKVYGESNLGTFSWDENTGFPEIWRELNYDETCNRNRCEIRGKKDPLSGNDNKPLWVQIQYKNQETYTLPLYWDEKRKIIDPIQLLPPKVQTYIAAFDAVKEQNFVLVSGHQAPK